jgi:hypothetical protein
MRSPITNSGCVKSQCAEASTAASGRRWRQRTSVRGTPPRTTPFVYPSGMPAARWSTAPDATAHRQNRAIDLPWHAPGRGSPTSSQPSRSADHAPPRPVADRSNQKTQSPTRGMRSGRRAGGANVPRHCATPTDQSPTRGMRSGRRAGGANVPRHCATPTDMRRHTPIAALAQKSSITHSRKAVGMAGFEPAASCSQSRRANQAALHPAEPTVAYRSSGFRAHCRPVRVGGSAAVVGG